MDYKKWKSGRHDPRSGRAAARFRRRCELCMKHKRTCPVCAGVI